MLRTIAPGIALGCVVAQALIFSTNSAAQIAISKCTPSTDGTIVCQPTCPVQGQGDDAAPPPPGSLASLLTEGYGIVQMQIPGGTLILRKKWSYTPTYICNREPIGSPIDEAFKSCRYDQVPCSLAPDSYP
jgi:hypothetical protein